MKKISSGVRGLDDLLDGGFIENRAILVQGDAGTGKTTLGLQYLINGANSNEPGILLSMEYETGDIIADTREYKWNVDKLLEENTLRIISPQGGFEDPEKMEIDEIINLIHRHVKEIGAKRLVIDSLNSLEISLQSSDFNRRDLLRFITLLRDLDCTTLLLAEKFQVEKDMIYTYLAHGVIELYNIRQGATRLRGIEVIKMRGVKHSNLIHSMSIDSDTGITVLPHEIDLGL